MFQGEPWMESPTSSAGTKGQCHKEMKQRCFELVHFGSGGEEQVLLRGPFSPPLTIGFSLCVEKTEKDEHLI